MNACTYIGTYNIPISHNTPLPACLPRGRPAQTGTNSSTQWAQPLQLEGISNSPDGYTHAQRGARARRRIVRTMLPTPQMTDTLRYTIQQHTRTACVCWIPWH